jgi:hypothetical protein
MNALKFLLPSLLAAGMVAVPLDVRAADDTAAPSSVQRGSGFRDTSLRSTSLRGTAHAKRSLRDDASARTPSFEAFSSQEFGTASLRASKEVPELSGSAAGASLALVGAGLLALTGRRKRKTPAQ